MTKGAAVLLLALAAPSVAQEDRNTTLSLFPPTSFFTVTPCRVADTRNPAGPSGGPALAANAARTFPVVGICGIPSTATAVAINVTVVDETDYGHLRVYPAGDAPPGSSTINFGAGQVRANNAIVPLGLSGQISVQCTMPSGSKGQTHFLFDVTGYFAAGQVDPVITTSDTCQRWPSVFSGYSEVLQRKPHGGRESDRRGRTRRHLRDEAGDLQQLGSPPRNPVLSFEPMKPVAAEVRYTGSCQSFASGRGRRSPC